MTCPGASTWVPVWVGSFISELLACEPFFMLFGSHRNWPTPSSDSHDGMSGVYLWLISKIRPPPYTSRRTGTSSSLLKQSVVVSVPGIEGYAIESVVERVGIVCDAVQSRRVRRRNREFMFVWWRWSWSGLLWE